MPCGKNIKEVVKRIRGMKWCRDIPIGPLGVYVKAREPEYISYSFICPPFNLWPPSQCLQVQSTGLKIYKGPNWIE
jgi:hypothetical protein